MTDPDQIRRLISPNEVIAFRLDVSRRNARNLTLASSSVSLYDERGNDLTATNLSGSASIDGDVLILPQVTGLTAGKRYELEALYTIGADTYETVILLECRNRGYT